MNWTELAHLPAMLTVNRASNDEFLDNDLHRENAFAAPKIHDFARIEVLSACCD